MLRIRAGMQAANSFILIGRIKEVTICQIEKKYKSIRVATNNQTKYKKSVYTEKNNCEFVTEETIEEAENDVNDSCCSLQIGNMLHTYIYALVYVKISNLIFTVNS